MIEHRTARRLLAGLTVAVLLAACGAGTSERPDSSTPAPANQSSAPAAAPTSTRTPSPATAIGEAADDGARIIEVEAVDARTRDLTVDSPAVGVVKVRLLLPARFDDEPATRWPVLYLLHTAMQDHEFWTASTDVAELTAATDLLVVMPDAGDWGNYSDWWNDGRGGPPKWETFHVVELRQLLERNWQAGDRRAVAGASMGGYGAVLYAARQPGMFRASASFSGGLDLVAGYKTLDELMAAFGATIGPIWGDPIAQADVVRAHDPTSLASALAGTQLYVSYGDGRPGPLDASSSPNLDPTGDVEAGIASQDATFLERLGQLGIPATVDVYAGTHNIAYWERALHRSLPLLLEALDE